MAPAPDLSKLMSYPPNSLGYLFAQQMTNFGLDPGFYRKVTITDDATYIVFRARQTHDIWHIITGFDIDVTGEVGIKAFELAQTRRPLAGIMIAGAFVKVLLNQPEVLDQLVDSIAIGYRMGRKAKPLLGQKWEEHWEKPLEEWRSQLNLEPMAVYVP
jgi:ubiquinone biosynthesis protein Coq4